MELNRKRFNSKPNVSVIDKLTKRWHEVTMSRSGVIHIYTERERESRGGCFCHMAISNNSSIGVRRAISWDAKTG